MRIEPDVFSYDDLVAEQRSGWDGVRDYQAREFLRDMRRGDLVILHHPDATPHGATCVARSVGEGEPDPTQFDPASKYHDAASDPDDPRWDLVTLAPKRRLRFVPLPQLRAMPELADCPLLARGDRLSVMPLTEGEFAAIAEAGGA
jgi:predicted RNA-binding protein with PUA-like domain